MSDQGYRVFISHGKSASWIAKQLAKEVRECGASTFLDETDIPAGSDFKSMIKQEIADCDELVALFTPWSARRFWVWSEVGAAWGQDKRVIAVLYGLTVAELEELGESKAVLEDINILNLNGVDRYLHELRIRVGGTE